MGLARKQRPPANGGRWPSSMAADLAVFQPGIPMPLRWGVRHLYIRQTDAGRRSFRPTAISEDQPADIGDIPYMHMVGNPT